MKKCYINNSKLLEKNKVIIFYSRKHVVRRRLNSEKRASLIVSICLTKQKQNKDRETFLIR